MVVKQYHKTIDLGTTRHPSGPKKSVPDLKNYQNENYKSEEGNKNMKIIPIKTDGCAWWIYGSHHIEQLIRSSIRIMQISNTVEVKILIDVLNKLFKCMNNDCGTQSQRFRNL